MGRRGDRRTGASVVVCSHDSHTQDTRVITSCVCFRFSSRTPVSNCRERQMYNSNRSSNKMRRRGACRKESRVLHAFAFQLRSLSLPLRHNTKAVLVPLSPPFAVVCESGRVFRPYACCLSITPVLMRSAWRIMVPFRAWLAYTAWCCHFHWPASAAFSRRSKERVGTELSGSRCLSRPGFEDSDSECMQSWLTGDSGTARPLISYSRAFTTNAFFKFRSKLGV